MTRLTLNDTVESCVMKIASGNPGAITAIVGMMKAVDNLEPDSALGPYAPIFLLDTFGIYEERVWMLYKDVCSCIPENSYAVLRAAQMGLVSKQKLNMAIDNHGAGIDVDDVFLQLKEELPTFGVKGYSVN